MDSTEIPLEKTFRGLTSSLVSAVREWMVILMLLIDSVFSFLITKSAHCWKLCTPCLLCSRLDHLFGDKKKGYIWDLICHHHKKEISSLVLCHVHNKLVDVHGLCENCLFSFATVDKSNAETYRLLVGKLGEDPHSRFDDDPLDEQQNVSLESRKKCSCCYEPWVSRVHSRPLTKAKSIGFEDYELDAPVSSSVVLDREDEEGRDNLLESARATRPINHGIDDLAHIGYRELKITSDTESEVLFSEEEEDLATEKNEYRPHLEVNDVSRERPIISLGDVLASEKLINQISTEEPLDFASPVLLEEPSESASLVVQEEPSILVPQLLLDDTPPHRAEFTDFDHPIGHGLEELNWERPEQPSNADAPPQADLISVENTPDLCSMESKLNLDVTSCSEDHGAETVDSNKSKTFSAPLSETVSQELIPVSNDPGPLVPNLLELGEAYKLAISSRGRQISSLLAEQWIGKDSSRVSEDLRVLLSQLSFTRGIEQTMNEVSPSPRFSVNSDEMKTTDGFQILQRRISLERNESSLSLDGSIISEIEGESVIDRLKRQIDHDKKLMSSLYKELEEERNASAIAANQAMAMITRLQEEKATLNMEASQYLRMMEEQTEYDDEALQKANDILAEKEKELQDMENELEYYRNKYSSESVWETDREIHATKARDIGIVRLESSQGDDGSSDHGNFLSRNQKIYDKFVGGKDVKDAKNSLFDFEDEKVYITQRLKKLEKMLHLFSNNGIYLNLDEGDEFGNGEDLGMSKDIYESENENVEHDKKVRKDNSRNQGRLSSTECCQVDEQNIELDHTVEGSPVVGRSTGIGSFELEISDLNRRLETLEADRLFLEHSINSLKNEESGLQFVREIASHLRELRMISVRGDQSFA